MAKTKDKPQTPKKPMSVELKAAPDHSLEITRKYSNLVQVQNSPYDMTLLFCDMPPIYDMAELLKRKNREIRVPVVSEIALPYGAVPALIKAIQQKYDEYINTYKKDKDAERNDK